MLITLLLGFMEAMMTRLVCRADSSFGNCGFCCRYYGLVPQVLFRFGMYVVDYNIIREHRKWSQGGADNGAGLLSTALTDKLISRGGSVRQVVLMLQTLITGESTNYGRSRGRCQRSD